MPMTIGSPEPMRHRGNSWTSVPMPAIIIALWMSFPLWSLLRPLTPATMSIGAIFATNMARMC